MIEAIEVSMIHPPLPGEQVRIHGRVWDVAETRTGWCLTRDGRKHLEVGIHHAQQQFVKAITEVAQR